MSEPVYGTSEHYLGESGQKYFSKQNLTFASKANVQFFQEHIPVSADVLDFGCGGGDLLTLLQANRKVGIEINPAAQEFARSRGLEIHTEIGDVMGQQFDFVISSHALEHVPNPYLALREFHKVLKPDGKLIWLSPMDDWRTRPNRSWEPNNHDMHLYAWTPQIIGNLVVTAGYKPLSVRLLTQAVPPRIGKFLWRFNKKLFEVAAYASAAILKRRQILVVAEPVQE